jgi:hypothetical protein
MCDRMRKMEMAASDRDHSQQNRALTQELAVVQEMLSRLTTKLQDSDTDHVPKEDDQELRHALQRIGDDRLTQLALDYSVCVRGLTGPMVSRAWRQELAEEAEETHRLLLNRLQRLEHLTRSSVGRLWLRLQTYLHQVFRKSPHVRRPPVIERDGHRERLL